MFRRQDPGTPDDPLDDQWWQDAHLTSPDELRYGDEFGLSVSVSDGVVLIGRQGWDYSTGSAYLYRRMNDVWVHDASLNPSDAVLDDAFGSAVSLSGTVALVGAYRRSDVGTLSGAAYIFRRAGSFWAQERKLLPSERAYGYFGRSVSLSDRYAVVGAQFEAYVYDQKYDPWSQEVKLTAAGSTNDFAIRVASAGDAIVIGDPTDGVAHLFCRHESMWVHCRRLLASDRLTGAQLGFPVAVNHDYAFVAGDHETVYVYVTPIAAKSLRDFATFQTCFSGNPPTLGSECERLDLASDGAVDLRDFNEWLALLAGP